MIPGSHSVDALFSPCHPPPPAGYVYLCCIPPLACSVIAVQVHSDSVICVVSPFERRVVEKRVALL